MAKGCVLAGWGDSLSLGLRTATQFGSVSRTWLKFWLRHLRNRLKLGVGLKLLYLQFLRALDSGSGSSFSLYLLSVGP